MEVFLGVCSLSGPGRKSRPHSEEVVGRGGRGRWATVRAPRSRAAGAHLGQMSWEAAAEPLPVAPTLPLTREPGPGVESEARPQRPGPASALPGAGMLRDPSEPRSRGQGGWGPRGASRGDLGCGWKSRRREPRAGPSEGSLAHLRPDRLRAEPLCGGADPAVEAATGGRGDAQQGCSPNGICRFE